MRTQNLQTPILPLEKGYLTTTSESVRKTFELNEFVTIGRDGSAQICLPDPFLSLRHARIEKKQDGFHIRDLQSRNGTYVNGSRILEAKLQDHDRLHMGSTEFIFSSEKDLGLSPTYFSSSNLEWDRQLKRIPAIAQSPHPILLLGPSGTGKEVLARMIHRLSFRSRGPFLSVNCSALTETLAESELFGHAKGSFTGAQEARKGAFESARSGTLFLDEVGDMPLSVQPKFLRALENLEVKPVGSDTPHPIDVRIVAATNKNLKEQVNKGRFREDLYFRLHILQISPPALKDRIEDFDTLLRHFARPLRVNFTAEALAYMKSYDWPGNIRELKNMISRASALFPNMPISKNELHQILDTTESEEEPNPRSGKRGFAFKPIRQYLQEYERESIIERLLFYNGNQRRAAQDLGIPKSTLNDRIKRFDIDVKNIWKYKAGSN